MDGVLVGGRRVAKLMVLIGSALLFVTACGGSGGEAEAESTTTDIDVATTTEVAVTSAPETTVTTAAPTTTEPPPVTPAAYTPLASDPPVGEIPGDMLFFDDDQAYWYLDGEFAAVGEGPFYEVVDDGAGGILYQADEWETQVIWWLPAGATRSRDLLVTTGTGFLVLEGLTGSGDDREIVYQRGINGDIRTDIHTLRTYRMTDATVTELTVTGGWESGTHISSVVDGAAVGAWSGEGFSGTYWLDLASREQLIEGDCCDDEGWSNGPPAWYVTIDSGELLGVGGQFEGPLQLIRIDRSGSITATIATFAGGDRAWNPEGIMVVDNKVVISRTSVETSRDDQIGTPLGPIIVDLETGEISTLPYAVHARPLSTG